MVLIKGAGFPYIDWKSLTNYAAINLLDPGFWGMNI